MGLSKKMRGNLYYIFYLSFFVFNHFSFGQKTPIVDKNKDGFYALNLTGASYFAQLSLNCLDAQTPHHVDKIYEDRNEILGEDSLITFEYWPFLGKYPSKPPPQKIWPSFYGCYDWHSSVHNTWCLIKLLKSFENLPEAEKIEEKLELCFNKNNIEDELKFLQEHEYGLFEFPYGQSWVLKIADELTSWDNRKAKKWLQNLTPLLSYIEKVHIYYWRNITPEKLISGSHDSPSLGLSFAHDFAKHLNKKTLLHVVDSIALVYYLNSGKYDLSSEPIEYDFMSGGLLVADIMRKTLPPEMFKKWLKKFSPELMNVKSARTYLKIDRKIKHDGYESHWDGYHLNRIWCLNGIIKSLGDSYLEKELRLIWINQMNEMWDYAQESIGKGNYDIDHWLSSFSVFALSGYD
jgi:hypothetical protein